MNPLYGHSSLYPAYGSVYSALGQRLGTEAQPFQQVSVSSGNDAYHLDLSAYGQLLSFLNNFQATVAQLGSSSHGSMLHATSSDSTIATANASIGAQAASYTLAVHQMAQAQTLSSPAFTDASSTVLGSGTLTISTGSYLQSSNKFVPDGSQATTINISNGTLDSIAKTINTSGAGLIASVLQNSDGYHLILTRKATGALQNTLIAVADLDGNNTDQSGLSSLAYDPTSSSGKGKNLTQNQAGRNAFYSVNGVNASYPDNSSVPLATGLSATLLSSGRTNITVGTSYAQLNNGALSLTNAFNTLQYSVTALVSSSSALQNDPRVARLLTEIDQIATDNRNNGQSALTSLPQIGIRYQSRQPNTQGSRLTLDGNTLQQAYAFDQGGAASLLALTARDFDAKATNYTAPSSGVLSQTMDKMREWGNALGTSGSRSSQSTATPYSMAAMLAQASTGVTAKSEQLLTAQQATAINQYSMILAMSQPVAINTLQNHQISQIPWLDNGNDISVFA